MKLISPGIILIKINAHTEIEKQDIHTILHHAEQLSQGGLYTQLVDMTALGIYSSQETRQYAATEMQYPNKVADALVVRSLSEKLIANFYIRINKPKIPTRLFNNEESAIKWLQKMLRQASK